MILKPVDTTPREFGELTQFIEPQLLEEVKELAQQLNNKSVLHINSSAQGGGVAEILQSLVPLLRDLGLNAHWRVLSADERFFTFTKNLHNALQGDGSVNLKAAEWQHYEAINRQLAAAIKPADWDYIVVHDPQPAAVINYAASADAKWVWRCHLDLSHPDAAAKTKFLPYLEAYGGYIFTLKDYLQPSLQPAAVAPVAIDPLAAKNQSLSMSRMRQIVAGHEVDLQRPFVCQVSRFDPWKDPLGVVQAWRLAKLKLPDLQLVLIGDAAVDDPQGQSVLEAVLAETKEEAGCFVFTDCDDRTVHAFQSLAAVVLQKSLREGFGLTVAEALWAGTPVIAGRVGGIPLQIKQGKNGYLVDSPKAAAKYMVELVRNPLKAKRLGQWGHEYVRRHFLLPRLIRDELRFWQTL